MRLTIERSVTLGSPIDAVWGALCMPERVAACVPGLESFEAVGPDGPYSTTLVERVGPFSVRVALTVEVVADEPSRTMIGRLRGEDRGGQARVRGHVSATVAPAGAGTRLDVSSEVEVLGRLASLGAVPIRRRGDQVFDQFVANLEALLGGSA